MARTATAITKLTSNGSITNPAGTNVDPTNGHIISGARNFRKLFLRATNTSAGAKNYTVKAGVNPPAESAGQGDLVVSVPATTGDVLIGPLESARFCQADGSIWVDIAASATGILAPIALPDRF